MSISFPLNDEAAAAADDAFYAAHPEMVVNGERIPIDPDNPDHDEMADEWIDIYEAELDSPEPKPIVPIEPVQPCEKHWIKFQFLSREGKLPLMGIAIEYTDTQGNELGAITDEQGLISLEDIPAGHYSLRCPLEGLTIADVFDVTGQKSDAVPTTAATVSAPLELPAHVKEGVKTGDSIPTDENDIRAQAVPWTPVAFAHVETRKVVDGEDLESLAAEVDMSWQQLARFNFDGEDPLWVNGQLRDLVGCVKHDENGNYSFQSNDDPGLMFLPRAFEAEGLETDTVHIFEGDPIKRPVLLEAQTVDDFGYRAPNVPLTLVRYSGETIQIQTDENGYWKDRLVLEASVDVYHENGDRAEFYKDVYKGRDLSEKSKFKRIPNFARLHPLLAQRGLSTILVPGRVDRKALIQKDVIRRRYGRTGDDRESAAFVAKEAGNSDDEAGGEVDHHSPHEFTVVRRKFFMATDNVYATYDDVGTSDAGSASFAAHLLTYLKDRHPTLTENGRGHSLLLVAGSRLLLWKVSSTAAEYEKVGSFDLNPEINLYQGKSDDGQGGTFDGMNPVGAYVSVEETEGGVPVLFDLETHTTKLNVFTDEPADLMGDDGLILVRRLMKSEAEEERFNKEMMALGKRVSLLYLFPTDPNYRAVINYAGASGMLEDYPSDTTVRARVHDRNLAVVRACEQGFKTRLEWYINNVLAAKTLKELHEGGPPPDPFRFHRPPGSTMDEWNEIRLLWTGSNFQGWLAVARKIDKLNNEHTSGSMFARCTFELATKGESANGLIQASAKVVYKFDFGTDGWLHKVETPITVSAGPSDKSVGPGKMVTAKVVDELDPKTGETKQTVVLGARAGTSDRPGRGLAVEIASDGEVKFVGNTATGQEVYSTWNPRSAEGGFGACQDFSRFLPPDQRGGGAEAKLCVGLHFVLMREDHLHAWLVGAPGFFEKRLAQELTKVSWDSLNGFEKSQLRALGWARETWDRRLPGDFPVSSSKEYDDLVPAQKSAAIKLGLGISLYKSTWDAERKKAQKRLQIILEGR